MIGATPEGEADIDIDRPNVARMYDYLLGGAQNFAADRDAARRAVEANPGLVTAARANRAFLGRVVGWCLDRGVEQFLDLGSGVPTVGNVHEIAQARHPAARVAYVDVEPVAAARAAELVAAHEHVTVTRADLRDVDAVLAAPGVAGLLDTGRPVAVLAVAVLHFVPGDVAGVLDAYRAALAPGSVLAISHGSLEYDDPDLVERMRAAIAAAYDTSTTPPTMRSREDVRRLLGDFEVIAPALVDVTCWPEAPARPDAPTGFVAAVGRKRT